MPQQLAPETQAQYEELCWAECPCYNSLHDCGSCGHQSIRLSGRPCPPECGCQGTGLAFPPLTEECPGTMGWIGPNLAHDDWAICPVCQGRNRIPKQHYELEEVVDIAMSLGNGEVMFLRNGVGKSSCHLPELIDPSVHPKEPGPNYIMSGICSSHLEGAIGAVHQAAKAKGII